MHRQRHLIRATSDRVWAVLADGWLYPLWVVGATAIRQVDATWPDQGSALHHATGFWPLAMNETTEVVESEEQSLLSLRVVGPLLGEVRMTLRLEPQGEDTTVTLERELVSGPRRLIPTPLRMMILQPWGMETLTRLGFLAERRFDGAEA